MVDHPKFMNCIITFAYDVGDGDDDDVSDGANYDQLLILNY